MIEVAREKEVAEAEAREDKEKMRKIRSVSDHIDGR